MTVYADVLVITNLYVDFFLLWCADRTLHLHTSTFRLTVGALTGALCALECLIPHQPTWLSFGWGILLRFPDSCRCLLAAGSPNLSSGSLVPLGVLLPAGWILSVPHPVAYSGKYCPPGSRCVSGPFPPCSCSYSLWELTWYSGCFTGFFPGRISPKTPVKSW